MIQISINGSKWNWSISERKSKQFGERNAWKLVICRNTWKGELHPGDNILNISSDTIVFIYFRPFSGHIKLKRIGHVGWFYFFFLKIYISYSWNNILSIYLIVNAYINTSINFNHSIPFYSTLTFNTVIFLNGIIIFKAIKASSKGNIYLCSPGFLLSMKT